MIAKKDKNRKPVVIVADTENMTFETFSKISSDIDLINLSSGFAVKFMLQREAADMVILSRRIEDFSGILSLAAKRATKVYELGKDITFPLEKENIEKFFKKEFASIKTERKAPKVIDFLKEFRTRKPGDRSTRQKNKKISPSAKIGAATRETKPVYLKTKNKRPVTAKKKKDINSRTDIKKNKEELVKIKTIRQKTIVFLKAKGGVGSTILSLFLGYNFSNLKTLLIDMNFSEGGSDLGYYLDIPKTPNMSSFFEDYSYASLSESVFKVKEGFDILQPPPSFNLYKKIDLQDIYELTDMAKKKYHLVIFDLPNILNELTLGVLDIGDIAVLVSDHSLGSIGRLISINDKYLSDDLEKVVVVNRFDKTGGSDPKKLLLGSIPDITKYHAIGYMDELKTCNPLKRDKRHISPLDGFNSKIFDILTSDEEDLVESHL